MIQNFVLLVFLATLSGCALKPTVATETPARKAEAAAQAEESFDQPIVITEKTVVIDARSAFDYSMAHIPRSINVKWSDFTEPHPASRGLLQKDIFAIARRLARMGVSIETPVVVVGRGVNGEGEEGRVAWMLAYLGVKNVRFTAIDSLKIHLTNIVTENVTSQPIWKPEPIESLNVTRAELLDVIAKSGTTKPLAFGEGSEPRLYRIVDVRSEAEYLGREGIGRIKKVPDMGAINIPWHQFFTDGLMFNRGMKPHLEAIGLKPEHRIIVLGNDGVSSAAVTMALRAMGYSNAGNYSGGLKDFLQLGDSDPNTPGEQ